MSNTYFRIETVDDFLKVKDLQVKGYKNEMTLSLNAFMGKDKTIQLTTTLNSTVSHQGGISFITLTNEQAIKLAGALIERATGNISATDGIPSVFMENKDDPNLG